MGFIDSMMFVSATPASILPFGSPMLLWVFMVGTLGVAAGAIILSVPRRRRWARPLYLVRAAQQCG